MHLKQFGKKKKRVFRVDSNYNDHAVPPTHLSLSKGDINSILQTSLWVTRLSFSLPCHWSVCAIFSELILGWKSLKDCFVPLWHSLWKKKNPWKIWHLHCREKSIDREEYNYPPLLKEFFRFFCVCFVGFFLNSDSYRLRTWMTF